MGPEWMQAKTERAMPHGSWGRFRPCPDGRGAKSPVRLGALLGGPEHELLLIIRSRGPDRLTTSAFFRDGRHDGMRVLAGSSPLSPCRGNQYGTSPQAPGRLFVPACR